MNGTSQTATTSEVAKAPASAPPIDRSERDRDEAGHRPLAVLLRDAQPFARPSLAAAVWQLTNTAMAFAALLACVRWAGATPWVALAILPFAGLVIRTFVLQHDCGHRAFVPSARLGTWIGRALSTVTGVPYDAWRFKHNWHHQHHGDLSQRAYDPMTPMTVAEARQAPDKARTRARQISLLSVFVLGSFNILVQHKAPNGFFMLRPGYPHPVRGRKGMLLGIRCTVVAHFLVHAALWAAVGTYGYLVVVLPGYFIAGGIGTVLFWVQHNFERSYYAPPDSWSFAKVSIEGSSYLKLPPISSWFSASIGLHHVHHLNPRIPNYRLEAARRSLPELRSVRPMDLAGVRRSFSHLFWDEPSGRMVPLATALADVDGSR